MNFISNGSQGEPFNANLGWERTKPASFSFFFAKGTSSMRIWNFGGGGRGLNMAPSCLLVTRKVKWKKGGRSRSQGETMQMWEGEKKGGAESSVHTMYMAYTQSCAEHMKHRLRRRTRHLEMGAGWDTEVTRRSQCSDRPWFNQLLAGGGGGRTGGGGTGVLRWTGSDNMQEQIWSATTTEKIWEFIPFRLMKKKEAFLGFCEKKDYKRKPSNWPTCESVFFFFLLPATQGVTTTEIFVSGWIFWRKHLSTCRQVKLELKWVM